MPRVRPRWSCPPVLLAGVVAVVSSCLWFCLCRGADSSTLERQIYTTYVNQGYCVRLGVQNGWVGCATPGEGTRGRIRLALDQATFDTLLQANPTDSTALLLDHTLLTRHNLERAAASLHLAGVMVLPTSAESIPARYSPASRTPQFLPYIAPSAAIPLPSTKTTMFNNTYQWNPYGEEMMTMQLPFAIVTVTANEQAHLLALARTNEANEARGDFVYNIAEFNFYMYGQHSTPTCLADATCIPVGGHSVWGSLGNLTSNSTVPPPAPESLRPFLLMTTKMDAQGFFHQMSPGGDESQASLAVQLAALRALTRTSGVSDLPMQILFAFFQGESYSHVGSRKFVDDIQHFECLRAATAANNDGDIPACLSPYKDDAAFLDVQLERIAKIVEVGQIGANETVFVHRQWAKDLPNEATDRMVETVFNVAANMSATSPLRVAPARADTPGLPPACAEAFLDARPSIATIMLTDHEGPYTNPFLGSHLDTIQNILSESAPGTTAVTYPNLCAKATLLARTVWIEAGGDVDRSLTIQADCKLIHAVLQCLLVSLGCDLIRSVAPNAYAAGDRTPYFQPPAHYTSVYNLLPDSYIGVTPEFLAHLVAPWVRNATVASDPATPSVNVHYHAAVDPNLLFDLDANRWRIKPNANDRLLYTESNWNNDIRWRTYRREETRIEVIALVVGCALAAFTVLATMQLQRYCQTRFKRL